jgi:hypothetical protein
VLYVLRYTDSDYPFDIFKIFFSLYVSLTANVTSVVLMGKVINFKMSN